VLPKQKAIVSKKIRQSAKGQECTVRIPGTCNYNPETTVFAHLNGGGMSPKTDDLEGAYCCSSCHDALDGRRQLKGLLTSDDLYVYHLEACIETRRILYDAGLINIPE